jgi:hypothetical protein
MTVAVVLLHLIGIEIGACAAWRTRCLTMLPGCQRMLVGDVTLESMEKSGGSCSESSRMMSVLKQRLAALNRYCKTRRRCS